MRKKRNKNRDTSTFWCRYCGAMNSIVGNWSAVAYGTVSLTQVEEDSKGDVIGPHDHDNWDDQGTDDYEVTSYECYVCGHGVDRKLLKELVTTELDDVKDLEGFEPVFGGAKNR